MWMLAQIDSGGENWFWGSGWSAGPVARTGDRPKFWWVRGYSCETLGRLILVDFFSLRRGDLNPALDVNTRQWYLQPSCFVLLGVTEFKVLTRYSDFYRFLISRSCLPWTWITGDSADVFFSWYKIRWNQTGKPSHWCLGSSKWWYLNIIRYDGNCDDLALNGILEVGRKLIPWQFSGFLPERICEYVWSIWAHVNSLWTLWCPKTNLNGQIRKIEFMAEIRPATWDYKNQWDQLTIYDIYELRLGGLDCRQGKDMIPFTRNHWNLFKVTSFI